MTAAHLRRRLRNLGDPAAARTLAGFFKTAPGQYGHGDTFLGIKVPPLRALAREHRTLAIDEVLDLLASPIHEERTLALMIWVEQFGRGDQRQRKEIFKAYMSNLRWVNNWDLVDGSAYQIVGPSCGADGSPLLDRLSRSRSLWQRRIAIVATLHFIRQGHFAPTVRIAQRLLKDEHDLIHKASGWMLREVAKRERKVVEEFLDRFGAQMPRTMLRYAIERFPMPLRQRYMDRTRCATGIYG